MNGLMHQFVTLLSLGEYIDPFAAAVLRICAQFDESFLFQPGQKTGNGGMGQTELRFQIPGTGGLFGMGQVGHNVSLGTGKFHGFQGGVHGMMGTPVQDPNQKSVMGFQQNHLLINVACYILV